MRTLLLATLLLLSACKTAPFTKGDDAAASMNAATATVERLRNAAAATKASFDPILAPDAKLRPAFQAFAESVDGYGRSIEAVKRAIADVEQATLAYIESYSAIREDVANTDLRAAMLMRRESIERQLADMKVELSSLLASTDVLSRELKDLRIFLEANLNAQAVGPAAPVGEKLAASIQNIAGSADRVSLELKDLAASLATERPE
jgi:hypothetical protein